MSIKLVVFDIAGTTVEDPGGVVGCLMAALESAGVSCSQEDANSLMGIPKPLAIRRLMEIAHQVLDTAKIEKIHGDFQSRMIEYYKTEPDVREVPGASEVFRKLRGCGISVALDTGFDRSIVDVLLKRLGWGEELLNATVASDEVDRGRPYPDLILHLMRQLSVESANEVAKVGDTPSDLLEGTAAGCGMVIGVTSGTHSREMLEPHPHTHLVKSVRDVPDLVLSS